MIRRGIDVTIFLVNNNGYTIEVQIHDNVYNNIQNWNYADLVQVFRGTETELNCHSYLVKSSTELATAIEKTKVHRGVTLIECILNRYDCTSTLLEWGSRVAASNSRL